MMDFEVLAGQLAIGSTSSFCLHTRNLIHPSLGGEFSEGGKHTSDRLCGPSPTEYDTTPVLTKSSFKTAAS